MAETKTVEILQFHIEEKKTGKKKGIQVDFSSVDTFENFCKNITEAIDGHGVDKSSKKVASIKKNDEGAPLISFYKKHGIISGILTSGSYGTEESVVDVLDPEKDVFSIQKNHAVKKPFFFLICFSPKKNTGFIILERHKINSINRIFSLILHRMITKTYPNHKIVIRNFIEPEITKKYIKDGAYKEVALTRSYLPADISDRYNLGRFPTDDYTIELSIKPRKSKSFPISIKNKLVKMFEGREGTFFSSEQFSELGFDKNSQIKVVSSYNNKERTVNLSGSMRIRPYYDLEVDINADGYSNYNSIHKKSVELIRSFGLEIFHD